jgi:signal transduction histidine kinase/ligand-binding sensor domain-containing protein
MTRITLVGSATKCALVLSASVLAGVPVVAAQDDSTALSQYLTQVWQTEDGLPQNPVQAITQTRDGYLWLGTPAGLVRFDGVRFTVFNQFANNNVHALLEDRAGTLWVGTYGAGLYRYQRGQFVHFDTSAGLESNLVRTLYEARDGTLWVGTNGGGVSFRKDGRFRTLRARDGLTNDIVRAFHEDAEGRLWIGTNARGINVWTGRNLLAYAVRAGRLATYTTSDAVSNDNVLAILRHREGGLWIGTETGGLWRLLGDRVARGSAEVNGVRQLLEDAHGNVWIGTDGDGLHRLRAGRIETITSREGLPNDIVLALRQDGEGSLWAGTRDGLFRLKVGKIRVYTTQDGLANDFVTALYGTRDGALWVGTRVGVDRFENGRAAPAAFRTQLPRATVLSLLEEPSGILWIGTRDGLCRVDRDRVTRITTADGLQANYVAAIAQAADGGVWVGTRGGLAHITDGRVRRMAAPTKQGLDVTAIHQGRDGVVWIGTDDAGLARLDNGRWRFYGVREGLVHPSVTALYDDGVSLWITTRQGLNRFKGGRLFRYSMQNGLATNQLFSIVDDRSGHLWLTSPVGISMVDTRSVDEFDAGRRERLSATAYDKADGMKTSECNNGVQPATWRAGDGRLWFSTVKGLAVIDPANIRSNTQPPPVLIEQVRVDDEPVPIGDAIALPPGRTRLEFHYTALSFYAPNRVRFRYRMEGFDPDWTEAGPRRVGYYTNLPPGRYRFRVMASNEDGVWNRTGAAFDFTLRARFYRTATFAIACVLASAVVAFGLYRLRVRRLTAQFAAVLGERNRIAREIHDTLAQSFVGIGIQLETVAKLLPTCPDEARQRLDRARILVRSSLAEARRSVWNLRSGALEHADLAGALSEVAEQLSGESTIIVQVTGTRRRLRPDVETNLLRIGQEALTNAVRHAQAHTIELTLAFGDGHVRLSVRDDGRGFDVESAGVSTAAHFGLAGMRERVRHLGGEFSLLSSAGQGAEVIVDVPV